MGDSYNFGDLIRANLEYDENMNNRVAFIRVSDTEEFELFDEEVGFGGQHFFSTDGGIIVNKSKYDEFVALVERFERRERQRLGG